MSHVKNFNLNGFYDSFATSQNYENSALNLLQNELQNDEAAFQPTISETQPYWIDIDSTFQNMVSSTEYTLETWAGESLQPRVCATTSQISDIQNTIAVTSHPSFGVPTTLTKSQPLIEQAASISPSNFLQSSNEESLRDELSPVSSTASVIENQLPSKLELYICTICGDRATGKHYGAISCDGCKGFFRRSVRKNQQYICRFKRNCVVTLTKRNQCRYCRLNKCFLAGMKSTAVQNERDSISYRRPPRKHNQDANTELTITSLLQAEKQYQTSDIPDDAAKVACVTDICNSMQKELLHFKDWAKKLPGFLDLSSADQTVLLKTKGPELLIFGVAKRSLIRHDSLLLGNNSIILKNMANTTSIQLGDTTNRINAISDRIWKELIEPWRSTNMDDVEFTCLKTISFFDPYTKGLHDKGNVEKLRNKVQMNLENYVNDRQYEGAGRLCKLFLTLLSIQSIAREMTDDIFYAEINSELEVSDTLQEMILRKNMALN